ncbi:MAG: 30S ribosomal protein S12 methylthiotransferase RimO [Phycisphaerales bacterium]
MNRTQEQPAQADTRVRPDDAAHAPEADPGVERIAFVSLGCPKNLVDSEKMLGLLAEDGLTLTDDHDEADAIVVNTCGFLEASKAESLEVISEAAERKRAGTLKRLVVAGCLVQRHRAKMLEWAPDIDALIGVFDRDHIVEAVRGVKPKRAALDDASDRPNYWIAGNAIVAAEERGMNVVGLTVNGQDGRGIGYFESDASRLRLTPRHYAYLRVSEGCNQRCAFCTIPSIRGKMRSKPVEMIVNEARELFADGAFELNLIGQDTTSFGHDIGYDAGLVGMLSALNEVAAGQGGGWLRLMYAYPSCFTDEMIDAIASLEHVVKYIDMPLQHINDRVLDSMRRNTSRALIEELLHKLRERIPGIAIRTTFITGFPGETEAEHEELLEFVEEFGFDMMGVFEYSPEPGTRAFRLESHPELLVDAATKKRRYDELMTAQQRVAFEQAEYLASFYRGSSDGDADDARAGRGDLENALRFDVLVDTESRASGVATSGVSATNTKLYVGRCYHQAPQVDSVTYIHSRERLSPGELVRCVIVDADGYDLIARPLADLERRSSLPILAV